MWAAGDWADWWDGQHREYQKILDEFVDEHPNWFGIIVATAGATASELGAGFVDVLRFGEGVAEGGVRGFGKDALRLISIAGPLGKGAKLAHGARSAKLARVIRDPGGGICAWISAAKALRQTNTRLFASVDDLLQALNLRRFPDVFSVFDDVLQPLRSIGAQVLRLRAPRTMADVKNAVPRDGSVVSFVVDWVRGGQNTRHSLYAFYDYLGRFRIADRTGQVVKSLDELQGYGNIGGAVTTEMALIKNVFMKFIGPKGTATLTMSVLATTTTDPETVAQAFEARKQSQLPKPPGARYHVVAPGDWLSKVAKKHYGDIHKWPVIYEGNRKTIGNNPDLIHPGQRLWIPDLARVPVGKGASAR